MPCHYDKHARDLALALERALKFSPGNHVELRPSGFGKNARRIGCFEIVVDGKTVWSKLDSAAWSDKADVYKFPTADHILPLLR